MPRRRSQASCTCGLSDTYRTRGSCSSATAARPAGHVKIVVQSTLHPTASLFVYFLL
jgi:hypothetical protein